MECYDINEGDFRVALCNSPLAWAAHNVHERVKILIGREDVKGDKPDVAEHRSRWLLVIPLRGRCLCSILVKRYPPGQYYSMPRTL